MRCAPPSVPRLTNASHRWDKKGLWHYAPMESAFTEVELLSAAHVHDILSREQCRELEQLVATRHTEWLHFFNHCEYWLLRRIARFHYVVGAEAKYCSLCGSSKWRRITAKEIAVCVLQVSLHLLHRDL